MSRPKARRRRASERDSSGTTEHMRRVSAPEVRVRRMCEGDAADSPTRAGDAHLWCAPAKRLAQI
jgi:hypothetical protein